MVEARKVTNAVLDESSSIAELQEKLMADGYADLTDPRSPLNDLEEYKAAAVGYVNNHTSAVNDESRGMQAAQSVPALHGR